MPYNLRRKLIYRIPTGIFFILLGLIIFRLSLWLSSWTNPENIFLTELSSTTSDFINISLGALFAAMAGMFSSIIIADLSVEREKDKMVLAFHHELTILKEKTKDIPTDGFATCISFIEQHKLKFYSDDGLYFAFRKEMFILDAPILKKLLALYEKIFFVENISRNPGISVSGGRAYTRDALEIHNHISEIKTKINELLGILNEDVEKITK